MAQPGALEPLAAAATPPSAFPETMRAMRAAYVSAELDAVSFERPLSRCDVRDCLGQCCTEGTSLGDEEVLVLHDLVRREREFFESHGINDPESQIQASGRPGAGGRTLVRDRLAGEIAGDFPVRFGHAACAFLVDGGLCAFQLLSVERGFAPWWWKPIRCWLHPISLSGGTIRLPDDASGRLSDTEGGGASAVTRCSRTTEDGGAPASELLGDELEWLGTIIGRDLRSELSGSATSSSPTIVATATAGAPPADERLAG